MIHFRRRSNDKKLDLNSVTRHSEIGYGHLGLRGSELSCLFGRSRVRADQSQNLVRQTRNSSPPKSGEELLFPESGRLDLNLTWPSTCCASLLRSDRPTHPRMWLCASVRSTRSVGWRHEIAISSEPPELLPLLVESGRCGLSLVGEPVPNANLAGVFCPTYNEGDVSWCQSRTARRSLIATLAAATSDSIGSLGWPEAPTLRCRMLLE